MQRLDQTLYRTPFSPSYWRTAVKDFRSLRTLVFAALMIAACVALSYIPSITLMPGLKIGSWGFLARAACGLVGGPVTALVFGFAEDTISYLLHPTGPYFPGYALTTMIGTLIYALFLYRARVTVVRIFLAKLFNNLQNVLIGSLWSAIMYTKESFGATYIVYVKARLVTNAIQLPVQVVVLTVFLAAILPLMRRVKIIPNQLGETGRISFGIGIIDDFVGWLGKKIRSFLEKIRCLGKKNRV